MKLRLAIAACLLGISNFSAYSQILGDPIYYQDFSAGIPSDWDSLNTTGIAHWEYRGPNTSPDLSVASRGSCGASSSLIQSLTYDNGFVIFDSNYWDDDGDVCGNLGSGQDPAPHTAALTTAPIDLTGVNTVVFTWQQHFKRYQSTLTVAVSNDGGNNWNTIYTAAPVYTSATEWQTFNVSAYAANQADFRIRFLFSGTYYWWQLDDIALYAPNANDIRILNPKYTTYNPTDTIPFNNMEYDSYPSVMIPPIKFSAEDQNIGGNSQTGCKLITKVKKAGDLTQMFNIQSGSTTIAPGQTVTHNIATTYTAPTTPENYIITYNVDQTQNDDDVSNNWDTLDFRITPFSYARDERTMEDAFTPSLVYQDETQQIGNVFQARLSSPKKCHAIGVGFSDLSEPGTVVHGVIYKLNTWEILAETEDYVVNIADLNAVGDEKIVSLPLITPLDLQQDSLYIVMVSHDAAQGGSMRVARSGDALPNVALLKYPDSNGLFYLLKHPMVRMHIFAASSTPGCTDPAADNYMPEADVDDGGCLFFGCTNVEACNFDPLANHDDGSCFLNYGCTNPAACNFDPIANCDDGSCLVDYGCMNPAACNYDPAATCEDGSCLVDYGCTNTAACNFDPVATCDDGSCLVDYGCMNPAACNYDPAATCEDGSCLVDYGCMNPVACNYDPAATCDDGSCLVDYGCMNPVACNYDPAATCEDGSCLVDYGCMNPVACNYDPAATCEDGSCLVDYGCMNPAACNYDPAATCEDGSCLVDYGCMDPAACNYDPAATCEDGSCLVDYGCMNPAACNYDPAATCDDGSCLVDYGCMNPAACNYDPAATCDDGSCLVDYGCMDPAACNYDAAATCDGGNCIVATCSDPAASNYDPDFVCGGGICLYCPGDLNDDSTVNITDFLIFTSVFGCTSTCGGSDLDDNGVVNIADFLIFTAYFGSVCGE